jgi:hypothetical protein
MSWYWFGILVTPEGHVKFRQVHARPAGGGWIVETWSKGIAGKLWRVRWVAGYDSFELAVQKLRETVSQWCGGYTLIEEGESPRIEYEEVREAPAGAASPDWWTAILQVDPDAGAGEVKRAFRRRAMETHPDRGGDAEEFKRVYAAWEHAKTTKGW